MRLIEQALVGLGYNDIAADLEQRSGVTLQISAVERFRHALLTGAWRAAIALLPALSVGDEKRMKEATFLILEQHYLEMLESRQTTAALMLLRAVGLCLFHFTHVHRTPRHFTW